MLKNLAHAQVEHENIVETFGHSIATDPLMLSGLVIVAALIIPIIVHKFIKSTSATVVIVLAELFIIGATMYSVVPVLSVICITAGFALSMLLMFGSFANEGKNKTH